MPSFNTFPWNTNLWSGGESVGFVYPDDLVVFLAGSTDDLFSLSDGVNVFVGELDESGHKVDLTAHPVVRGPGVEVTDRNDREKIITIDGWLEATSAAELEELKDTMRRFLSHKNGYLDITRDGVVKRWEATLINPPSMFSGFRGSMIDWSPYKCQFFCRDYGGDRVYTSDTPTDLVTASPSTFIVDYAGSANGRPVIILVFSAASAVTEINIQNDESGLNMTITEAVSAGDSIIIDAESKRVTLNSTRIGFDGTFPDLVYGTNTFRFTVTGSSFSYRPTVKYRKLYR